MWRELYLPGIPGCGRVIPPWYTRLYLPVCVRSVHTRLCLPVCKRGTYRVMPPCVCNSDVYTGLCLPVCVTVVYRGMPPCVCNSGVHPGYTSLSCSRFTVGYCSGCSCATLLSVAGFLPVYHPFHCWTFSHPGFIFPVSLLASS